MVPESAIPAAGRKGRLWRRFYYLQYLKLLYNKLKAEYARYDMMFSFILFQFNILVSTTLLGDTMDWPLVTTVEPAWAESSPASRFLTTMTTMMTTMTTTTLLMTSLLE